MTPLVHECHATNEFVGGAIAIPELKRNEISFDDVNYLVLLISSRRRC